MNRRGRGTWFSWLLVVGSCSPEPREELASVDEPVTGLVAAYGFDETSGSTTADASPNRLTGTLTSATRVAGKFGGGLRFNGSSSWVTVADAAALHLTTGMTLEAWVNPSSLSGWREIAYKEAVGTFSYCLLANTSGSQPDIAYASSSGSEQHEAAGTTLPLGAWTHLAGTFDGTTLRLYRNGSLAGSRGTSASIGASSGPLRFGGSSIEGEFFDGVIDEVRIYSRALSQAEIQTDLATPIGSGSGGSGGADAGASGGAGAGGSAGTGGASAGGAGGSAGGAGGSTGGAGASTSAGGASGNAGASGSAGASGAGGSATGGAGGASGGGMGGGSGTAGSGGGGGGGGGASGASGAGGAGGTGGGGVYPLRIASGRRYLVDQSGAPFLIQGDAAWSLIANVTIEEATTYLADRSARGFNTVIANLIEHDFAQNAPRNVYGDPPFTTPNDFSTPNEAYFARADAVIRAAAARGIQVLLFPTYLGSNGGNEGWYQPLVANGSTKAFNWGVYVGSRYRTFDNIIWVMGGDYSPPASGKALVNAVANGIRSVDTRHLMTEHGSSWAVSSMSDYAGQPWLDVDAVYVYEQNGAVEGDVIGEYNRSNWLPVFLVESQYENELSTQQAIRRQAYGALLSGAMGQVFGNSPIWCFSTNGGCIYGGPGDWRTSLGSPGAQDQTRLHDLFATRAWSKLVPDANHAFVTSGYSGASVERAADGSWGAAYLPSSRTMTVSLSGFSRSTSGKWFNPSTGAFTTIAGSPFANSGTVNVTPPSAGDWVLIFE